MLNNWLRLRRWFESMDIVSLVKPAAHHRIGHAAEALHSQNSKGCTISWCGVWSAVLHEDGHAHSSSKPASTLLAVTSHFK